VGRWRQQHTIQMIGMALGITLRLSRVANNAMPTHTPKTNRKTQPASAPGACYAAGERVLSRTTSGEPILCTVIERDSLTGEWLLNSPAHGYAIQRSSQEIERYAPAVHAWNVREP